MSDLDATFAATRERFDIPGGVIYLDGNSLGPLMHGVRERVAHEIDDHWQADLIKAWNTADWIDLPARVGDRIGQLIGASSGSVIAADSTSVNLFKVLSAALGLAKEGRRTILSDTANFPTDLYVAQGLTGLLDDGYELRTVEPDEVAGALGDDVAVLMLTQVDYRTGRRHDMAELTRAARDVGALTVWDLCHSAGAFPVDVTAVGADFAIGCGYKYLNGGPGAPSYVYVRPEHADAARVAIAGWLGHAEPFTFDLAYRPAPGIDRMRTGTPPILSMAALDAALDIWDEVAVGDVRARSVELCELFISEVETGCGDEVELASPRDPAMRGSQVSFRHAEGFAVMQALIARDVIGDFRMPDLMRFGFAPLYVTRDDVVRAAEVLGDVLRERLWDAPEYKSRGKVT